MGVKDWFRRGPVPAPAVEARAMSIENPSVPLTADNLMMMFGGALTSATGVAVTVDSAMRVPAFAAGVGFIAGTLAGLPLKLYRRAADGTRKPVSGGIADLLHYAPNETMSSFEWRKHHFEQVLTGGRGVSFIERNGAGAVIAIWPLDPTRLTIKSEDGRKHYEYRDGGRRAPVRYEAHEVIDTPFMLKSNGLAHRSPVEMGRDVLGLALAMTDYSSRFFQNGGVPAFMLQGNFQTPRAMDAAAGDMEAAVKKASTMSRQALVLPTGLTVVPLGIDAQKSQMLEAQVFVVQQVARLLSLPPVFLQDLSKGTFNNVEQQDIHLVKHTIKRWAEQFEQELNLKLFGWKRNTTYAELSLDGLMRGDFRTRIEAYARAISTGQMTPDEVRDMENRARMEGGDRLYMQGAMAPITGLTGNAGPDAVPPDGSNGNDTQSGNEGGNHAGN